MDDFFVGGGLAGSSRAPWGIDPAPREFGKENRVFAREDWTFTQAMSSAPLPAKMKDRYESIQHQGSKDGAYSNFFGTVVYRYKAKVKNTRDTYHCLRRVKFDVGQFSSVAKALEQFVQLEANPCICALRQAFVTNEFADWATEERHAYDKPVFMGPASLVFAYEWKNPADTTPVTTLDTILQRPCPEKEIWYYISQILVALKQLHDKKLAARVMKDPSRILLCTASNRIYLNCLGMKDALDTSRNPTKEYLALQKEDLRDLGQLILWLAGCGDVLDATSNTNMSRALQNLVVKLLPPSWEREAFFKVDDVLAAVNCQAMLLPHKDLLLRMDAKEAELKEEKAEVSIWSDMLYKLVSICERPRVNGDIHWAETGDRYLCKLFRDHLFFRSTDEGALHLDKDDVAVHLRKLHEKSGQKIVLTSPDRNVVLSVSYRDVSCCIESSYEDLKSAVRGAPPCGERGG